MAIWKSLELIVKRIVAGARYESEENVVYLDHHGLEAYIKPSNYETSKTRKYKQSLKEREALTYHAEEDVYENPEGKIFHRVSDSPQRRESKYISTSKVYRCFDWNQNGQKTKSYYFNDLFETYRKKSLENITSSEGNQERMNRRFQGEGAFSKRKDGLKYQ